MKRVIFILVLLLLVVAPAVKAADTPTFSTCPNPGGTLLASFPNGTHGIAGDFTSHTGSDNVFQLTDTTFTQCFCPADSSMGTQTNWLDVSNLPQFEIDSLINSGWIFVGNGADWGLAAHPFVAKNIQFSCNPQSGGLGGGNGSTNSNPTVTPVPQVQSAGVGGQVLGLAATGNDKSFIRLILAVLVGIAVFFTLLVCL